MPRRKPSPRRVRKAAGRRTRYHHGNLREALITATLRLIEENGAGRVSVRDAARRAGVSSGAPFRHFPSREALMAAVAEEAQRRFRAEIAAAQAALTTDDPLVRLRAMGEAYVSWVLNNPAHFQVISSRWLFDYDRADALKRDNEEVIEQMDVLLREAEARGQLREHDLRLIRVTARALVYGLARMTVDGHLPRWGVAENEVRSIAAKAIALLVTGFGGETG